MGVLVVLAVLAVVLIFAFTAFFQSEAAVAKASSTNFTHRVAGKTFRFEIQPRGDGAYDILCRERPRNHRTESPPVVHIYSSGLISVRDDLRPRTLDRAKAIASYWAEGYSEYLRTGRFPEGKRRIIV